MNKAMKKIMKNAERKESNLGWGILMIGIALGILSIALTLIYDNMRFLLIGVFLIGMLLPLYGLYYVYLSDKELKQLYDLFNARKCTKEK